MSVYVCTKTTYAWQREKRKFYYRQNAVYPSSTLFLWVCICAQKPCMHDKERRGTCIIDKMLYIPVHLCVYVCVCAWACVHEGTCESAATSQWRRIFQQGIYNNYNFNAWCIKEMLFFVQLYGKFCYILAGQKTNQPTISLIHHALMAKQWNKTRPFHE